MLFRLLEFHKIKPDLFFKQLLSTESYEDTETRLMHDLKDAYYSQNTKKLDYLFREAKKLSLSKFATYQIILLEAMFKKNINDIPEEVKEYIRNQLFENENWTDDIMMLSFFGSATMFLSPENLDIHMDSIIKKYSNISALPLKVQSLVSSITLNYLYYTYSAPNKRIWNNCFTLLDNLSIDPSLSHCRIINLYFKTFLNKDYAKLQAIKKILQDSGETRISSLLPL